MPLEYVMGKIEGHNDKTDPQYIRRPNRPQFNKQLVFLN